MYIREAHACDVWPIGDAFSSGTHREVAARVDEDLQVWRVQSHTQNFANGARKVMIPVAIAESRLGCRDLCCELYSP